MFAAWSAHFVKYPNSYSAAIHEAFVKAREDSRFKSNVLDLVAELAREDDKMNVNLVTPRKRQKSVRRNTQKRQVTTLEMFKKSQVEIPKEIQRGFAIKRKSELPEPKPGVDELKRKKENALETADQIITANTYKAIDQLNGKETYTLEEWNKQLLGLNAEIDALAFFVVQIPQERRGRLAKRIVDTENQMIELYKHKPEHEGTFVPFNPSDGMASQGVELRDICANIYGDHHIAKTRYAYWNCKNCLFITYLHQVEELNSVNEECVYKPEINSQLVTQAAVESIVPGSNDIYGSIGDLSVVARRHKVDIICVYFSDINRITIDCIPQFRGGRSFPVSGEALGRSIIIAHYRNHFYGMKMKNLVNACLGKEIHDVNNILKHLKKNYDEMQEMTGIDTSDMDGNDTFTPYNVDSGTEEEEPLRVSKKSEQQLQREKENKAEDKKIQCRVNQSIKRYSKKSRLVTTLESEESSSNRIISGWISFSALTTLLAEPGP